MVPHNLNIKWTNTKIHSLPLIISNIIILQVQLYTHFTCVVDVMETTNDGTLEQLRLTRRPWKQKQNKETKSV